MQELHLPFECHTSNYAEDMEARKNPAALAKFLALGKAQYIAHQFSNSIIIGADTFITIKGHKIGKPSTRDEAYQIIESMSGKTINVHSGLAVVKTDSSSKMIAKEVEHIITTLKIKKMTPADIRSLAEAEEALQISGAFSIEGEGGKMVERIEGDYNNVIGLPLFKLREILKRMEINF